MLSVLADGLGLGERAYRNVVIEIWFPSERQHHRFSRSRRGLDQLSLPGLAANR